MQPWDLRQPQIDERSREAQTAENSGRLAVATVDLETTGLGSLAVPDPVTFNVVFTERPAVSHGADVSGFPRGNGPLILPSISGAVYEWDLDDRGHYRGAWVAVNIYAPLDGLTDNNHVLLSGLRVRHDFTFIGPAYKDVSDVAEELE